jgi:hypothetical protein
VQHCIHGSFHAQGHDKSTPYSSLNSHMSCIFCFLKLVGVYLIEGCRLYKIVLGFKLEVLVLFLA